MKKRIFSVLLTMAMVLSMASTAFASLPGDQDITGGGTVTYEDFIVLSAVLPTNANFDFKVDPLGLLGIEIGETASLDSLTGGSIEFSGAPASVINNSSVPVILNVKLEATTTGTVTANFVATTAAVGTGTTANALLYAEPSKSNVKVAVASNDAFVGAGVGIPFNATASDVKFGLDAADYVVSYDGTDYTYVPAAANNGNGTAIKFGGEVNPNADWSAFAGTSPASTIGMKVKFGVTKLVTGDTAITTTLKDDGADVAFALLGDGTFGGASYTAPVVADLITIESATSGTAAAPSFTTTTATLSKTTKNNVEYGFDLGSGNLKATGFASVTFVDGGGTARNVALGTHYTVAGNKLTFTGSSAISNWATGSAKITVTFDDSASTVVVLTMTVTA